LIARCSVGILTDYRGLKATELAELRRRLRDSGVDYKVVKNTLLRFAAERAGRDELTTQVEGPLAIAFGYGDITEPAKALSNYIETTKASLSIKGGFLGERLLTSMEVATLSKLPPREVLLARVVGGVQMPLMTLVGQLSAPLRGFVGVLQARIQQLGGE